MLTSKVILITSVIITIFYIKLSHSQDSPRVSTSSGRIRGHHLLSYKGQKYEAYEGIPYALPPIENRRFEPPQPIESWPEELVADKFRDSCVGYINIPGLENGQFHGIEDCLYLNVYVPQKKSNESLPVIFWIYGGAFQYRILDGTEQHYLIDHDVIFISMNYRMGALGFLSTEDDAVSGNMGLKDQSVALQWVSKNIEYFGGDPKKITLVGLSAGGASVHYHYLSPMSKGLFHTGLSLSGTAFDNWAQAKNSREKAIKLGELVNCPTSNMTNMLICLKECSVQDLGKAQAKLMANHSIEIVPFGPVVEKFSPQPFINRSPIEIIRSGNVYDVPWITGIVSEEAIFLIGDLVENKTALEELDKNWESRAPYLLEYFYTIPSAEHAAVARQIRKHYFDIKPINKETIPILIQMLTDRFFVANAEKAVREQARANKSPVMFYYYDYRANSSAIDILGHIEENYGVCHTDDALLVLGNSIIINRPKTNEDMSMQNELIQFWTSVVFNGFPHRYPHWERVDPNNKSLKYFHMKGPNKFYPDVNKNLAQKIFWNTLPFNENRVD